MELLALWVIFAALIGLWSRNKGGSFVAGFVFSLLLSPLIAGLIVALRNPNSTELESNRIARGNLKKCPSCAELVKIEATKCKHCGAELTDELNNLGIQFDGSHYCVGQFKFQHLRDAIQHAQRARK